MRRISWLLPAAASAAALLAFAAPVAAHQRRGCSDQFVRAVIAGKPRCLQWQMDVLAGLWFDDRQSR